MIAIARRVTRDILAITAAAMANAVALVPTVSAIAIAVTLAAPVMADAVAIAGAATTAMVGSHRWTEVCQDSRWPRRGTG